MLRPYKDLRRQDLSTNFRDRILALAQRAHRSSRTSADQGCGFLEVCASIDSGGGIDSEGTRDPARVYRDAPTWRDAPAWRDATCLGWVEGFADGFMVH